MPENYRQHRDCRNVQTAFLISRQQLPSSISSHGYCSFVQRFLNAGVQKVCSPDAYGAQRFLPDLSQSMTLAMLCAMLVLFNNGQVVEWSYCRRLLKEGKKHLDSATTE
ncbi:MAG: hypothetical protein WAV92_02185 [Halopseudomonas yangmingensis]